MKKSILFFAFLCFSLFATGKNNLEALKESLKSASGKEKIDLLTQLSQVFSQANQLKEATSYAEQAFDLATKLDDKEGLVAAYNSMGLIMQARFDYKNALKEFYAALDLNKSLQNKKGIADSKNHIGRIHYLQDNQEQAQKELEEAMAIWESVKDPVGLATSKKYLGDVFLKKEIYGTAQKYYKQALDLLIQTKNYEGASDMATLLGKIEYDLGDYEGALTHYNRAKDFNQMLGNQSKVAGDFYNSTLAYIAQGAYEDALEENESAEKIWQQLGDDFGLAQTAKNFGIIYSKMGKLKKATQYLERSAGYLKIIGNEPGTEEIYKSLATTYAEMGNMAKAYEHFKKYSTTKDFLFNKEKNKALLELTTKYESAFDAEKKQKKIDLLKIENASETKIKYALFAVIALICALLASLFRSYKIKKEDNKLLTAKNEEIKIKNLEIKEKNENLDQLNQKLVHEMAERESIEESSFARDRFLATMSHEMRTPMNAIVGLTHLLLTENPRTDQIEHLRTLQFSANNMTVFINDVLDFSKIEAGKLVLDSREFEPQRIFDEVKHRFLGPVESKGLVFNYHYDRKIPTRLVGDPARLNQILTNLVAAALKNTHKGFISLDVKLHEFRKQEVVIFISVTDSGIGMGKEILDKMFKKYGPDADDNFEGYDGAGLGLAITKRFVDLQNGLIEVHSEPNQGTSFRLFLPFKFIEEEIVQVKNDKGELTFNHLAGNKILIVEDNKINQIVVAKILRKLGIEAFTAENGREGVELFKKHDFDLILMDIQMPILDGYRATAEIRNFDDPKKRDVPIIALTASAFLSEKEKAKLFGMNDHIGKPFGPEELLEKISNALAAKVNS